MNLKDRFATSVANFARRVMSTDAAAQIYKPYDDFYYRDDPLSEQNSAGANVTISSAQRITVINACIRIVADSIASLPMNVFKRVDQEGSKSIARDHWLQSIIAKRPNEYQTPFEFRQEFASNIAAHGNHLAEKVRLRRSGQLAALWGLRVDCTKIDWLNRKSGRKRVYDVSSENDGKARTLTSDDVWHPRLRSLDHGLTGASPIKLNAEGIGLAIAASEYAGKFFSNGGRVAGFVSPENALTKKQTEELEDDLNKKRAGGAGHHTFKVYRHPMNFSQVAISPEDAQLAEMMGWSIADCARIWGVPLWLIQHQEKDTSWGSGIEQMGIGFDVYTLAPLVKAIEDSMDFHLLDVDDGHFVEVEMNALKRADLKTLAEYFSKALNSNNPWLTRNDVRKEVGKDPDPSPEGDEFLRATNNTGPAVDDGNDDDDDDDDETNTVPANGTNGSNGAVSHA